MLQGDVEILHYLDFFLKFPIIKVFVEYPSNKNILSRTIKFYINPKVLGWWRVIGLKAVKSGCTLVESGHNNVEREVTKGTKMGTEGYRIKSFVVGLTGKHLSLVQNDKETS